MLPAEELLLAAAAIAGELGVVVRDRVGAALEVRVVRREHGDLRERCEGRDRRLVGCREWRDPHVAADVVARLHRQSVLAEHQRADARQRHHVHPLDRRREPFDPELGEQHRQLRMPFEDAAEHHPGEEHLRGLMRLQHREVPDQAGVVGVRPPGMDHRGAHPHVQVRDHAEVGRGRPDAVELGMVRRDAVHRLRPTRETRGSLVRASG